MGRIPWHKHILTLIRDLLTNVVHSSESIPDPWGDMQNNMADMWVNIKTQAIVPQEYNTYSGVCVVNLKKLNFVAGKSDFFQTVAKYEDGKVKIVEPHGFEYWDFGTTERYFSSMFRVLADHDQPRNKNSGFNELCDSSGIFKGLDCKQFRSSSIINLSRYACKTGLDVRAIVIDSNGPQTIFESGIYYKKYFNSI